MSKILLTVALTILTFYRQEPASIQGKWMVDKVDVGTMTQKLTPQQIEMVNNMFIKPLTNAVFEFRADHHFYLVPGLENMPKNDSWDYDKITKVINIKEFNNSKSEIMKIVVLSKEGATYFRLAESPVVLKVRKL